MPKWINVKKPFSYRWPGGAAMTDFTERDLGDHYVKDDLAAHALKIGAATEGKGNASSRSKKAGGGAKPRKAKASTTSKATSTKKPSTRARPRATDAVSETAANLKPADRLADEDADADGAASDGRAVDSTAS